MNITNNTFIILYIILFINLNIVVSANTNKNDNTTLISFHLNKYFNYHNYSYIQENIVNEPNIIYYLAQDSNERIFLVSNGIADLSKPMISNGLLGVSLNLTDSKPFPEIITSKTNSGILLSGSLHSIKNSRSIIKCGGVGIGSNDCLEYIDIVNNSNENDSLYHISMFYYPSNPSKINEPVQQYDGSISFPNSNYNVIGMSFTNKQINDTNSSLFKIVVGTQLDSDQTIGKDQTHYHTNIEIDPLDLNSFKYVHDKTNNVYYSLVKSNVISSNGTNELYLVIFNVGNKTIESKRIYYFDGMELDFSLVGLGAYGNNKFFIVATPPDDRTYIYEFSLDSMLLNGRPDDMGVYIDTFIKCENSRFLLCYSNKDKLLQYIDLHKKTTIEYIISFNISNSNEHVKILHMYASSKVDESIVNVHNESKSKFWLFCVIFFPIVSFIVLVVLVIFAVKLVIYKRNKNFNDLQKVEQKNEKQESDKLKHCGADASASNV